MRYPWSLHGLVNGPGVAAMRPRRLNLAHPITRGLVFATIYGDPKPRDYTKNPTANMIIHSSYGLPVVMSRFGPGIDLPGGGSGYFDWGNPTKLQFTQADSFSGFTGFTMAASNGSADLMMGNDSFQGTRTLLQWRMGATHKLELFVGSAAAVLGSIAGATTVDRNGIPHTAAYVRNVAADTLSVYLDGRLDGTGADASTGTWNLGSTVWGPGGINAGSSSSQFQGKLAVDYLWNRALAAHEVAQLHLDPFCIFEPSPPEILLFNKLPAVDTTGTAAVEGIPGILAAIGTIGLAGEVGLEGIPGVLEAQGAAGLTGEAAVEGIPGVLDIDGVAQTDVSGAAAVRGIPGIINATGTITIIGAAAGEGAPGILAATGVVALTGSASLTGIAGIINAEGLLVQDITGEAAVEGVAGILEVLADATYGDLILQWAVRHGLDVPLPLAWTVIPYPLPGELPLTWSVRAQLAGLALLWSVVPVGPIDLFNANRGVGGPPGYVPGPTAAGIGADLQLPVGRVEKT